MVEGGKLRWVRGSQRKQRYVYLLGIRGNNITGHSTLFYPIGSSLPPLFCKVDEKNQRRSTLRTESVSSDVTDWVYLLDEDEDLDVTRGGLWRRNEWVSGRLLTPAQRPRVIEVHSVYLPVYTYKHGRTLGQSSHHIKRGHLVYIRLRVLYNYLWRLYDEKPNIIQYVSKNNLEVLCLAQTLRRGRSTKVSEYRTTKAMVNETPNHVPVKYL